MLQQNQTNEVNRDPRRRILSPVRPLTADDGPAADIVMFGHRTFARLRSGPWRLVDPDGPVPVRELAE
jgi:hypothetical protein